MIGVVLGTTAAPRVTFVKRGAVIDGASFAGLDPTRIVRYAARCQEMGCAQYSEGRCTLAARIASELRPVAEMPPPCSIRDTCRWHTEEGTAACLRCPQVVTLVPESRTELAAVARVPTPRRPTTTTGR